MMFSDTKRAAFIHIPKCAGTTIRETLKVVDDIVDWNYIATQSNGETLDFAHIPLVKIKTEFPAVFRKLEAYESFAIVRDPESRFISALRTHLMMYRGLNISQMTINEIHRESERICERISEIGDFLPYKLIHFQRQTSYVYVGERRVIRRLFHSHDLQALPYYIEELFGVTRREIPHKNHSVTYRDLKLGQLFIWLRRNYRVQRLVPNSVKPALRRVMYKKGAENLRKEIIIGTIRKFVEQYYDEDFGLISKVEAENERR